jgi:hypothetical protein
MNPFALLAPLFLILECWQLYLGERYMGIKQIRANADPRELPMSKPLAAGWSLALLAYYAWMFTLLLHPVGRAQGAVLLIVTAIGYSLRSACGLTWVLVVLTFEGAIRIGMLLSLCAATWRAIMKG